MSSMEAAKVVKSPLAILSRSFDQSTVEGPATPLTETDGAREPSKIESW